MHKIIPDSDSTLRNLTSGQINELEMHSFINLLNVIYSQLELLLLDNEHNLDLHNALAHTRRLLGEARNDSLNDFFLQQVREFKNLIRGTLHALEKRIVGEKALAEVCEARALLEQTFLVLDDRLEELNLRLPKGDEWHETSVDAFRNEFEAYFKTQEKNSRGRFRIVMDDKREQEKDYLILTDIKTVYGKTIIMPLLFKDVIRDLVSNARKYTPPGGTIRMKLRQKDGLLRFLVSDTGIGIPEDELPMVFEYGYRATNAESIRTMGGGFGLTKALHVVRQFRGNLFIESEPDNGTTITIELPIPEVVQTRYN